MATAPEHRHATSSFDGVRRKTEDGILPLTVRQRLWDQLWTRLLAPPPDPGDRSPMPAGPPHDPERR
jgi:hypothetical protein